MLIFKILSVYLVHLSSVSGIITGLFATHGQFPYQVAILKKGGRLHCGGSIISENFIITAGHCVANILEKDIEHYKIIVGTTYLKAGDGKLFNIAQIIVHPQFDQATADYDVALIKLSYPIQLGSAGINKILLVETGVNYPAGTRGIVSGFGGINDKSVLSPILKYSNVELWNRSYCNKLIGYKLVTGSMICAGLPSGQVSQCEGDSGGPLIVDTKLYGIVSGGFGCKVKNVPGIYAYVGAFRKWIKQNSGV